MTPREERQTAEGPTIRLPRIAVAAGHRWWLARAREYMRSLVPTAEVLVLQYERGRGRIGFDSDDSAQSLFRWIIGAGISWNARERKITEYTSGSPTDYVRELFKAGFSVPVTVVPSTTPPDADIARKLQRLAVTDLGDDNQARFVAAVAPLALACERVCVHSVAQWETIVLTRDPTGFIERLEAASAEASISFERVADESLLPQW